MKKMKLFSALVAVVCVIFGSAFKSNKVPILDFGMLTNGTAVPGQSNFQAFEVADFAEVTNEQCIINGSTRCSFEFDDASRTDLVKASPVAGDYAAYNWIELSYNPTTKVRLVHVKITGANALPLTYAFGTANKEFDYTEK